MSNYQMVTTSTCGTSTNCATGSLCTSDSQCATGNCCGSNVNGNNKSCTYTVLKNGTFAFTSQAALNTFAACQFNSWNNCMPNSGSNFNSTTGSGLYGNATTNLVG